MPPFGAIHIAWSSPHVIEQWIRQAPSPAFTPARLHAVVDDHVGTRFAVAPYTPASARLREGLAELTGDGVSELLAALDRHRAATSADGGDGARRGEPLPVNTITAPVFDHHGKVAFAVALHLADPTVTLSRIESLAESLLGAVDRMTASIGGRLPIHPRPAHEAHTEGTAR